MMKKILVIFFALSLDGIYCTLLFASEKSNCPQLTFAQLVPTLTMPCDEEIQAITNIETMHKLERTLQGHYDKINKLFKPNADDVFSSAHEFYQAIDIKSKLCHTAIIIGEQIRFLEQENAHNQKESSSK